MATTCSFDTWPLFVVKVGVYEPGQPEALMRGFDQALARGEKYACVLDPESIGSIPPAHERKKIVAWCTDPAFVARQKLYNVASATIIRSAVARGALTAFTWVWNAPVPQLYPGTLREGVDWCLQKLEEDGVEITPAARLYAQGLRPDVSDLYDR